MENQVSTQVAQLKNEDLEKILKAQDKFFKGLALFSAVQLILFLAIF